MLTGFKEIKFYYPDKFALVSEYFKSNSEIINFDMVENLDLSITGTIEIKFKNWEHIIQDGIDNFPSQFLGKYFFNINYTFINYKNTSNIKERLKKTNKPEFKFLKKIIKKATNNSLEMYKHDDSLIAQIYYAKHDSSSYLIPLYILQSEKPDMVLL